MNGAEESASVMRWSGSRSGSAIAHPAMESAGCWQGRRWRRAAVGVGGGGWYRRKRRAEWFCAE
jgi:hypothetical protein